MKKEIRERQDVIELVNGFYEKVRKDAVIGYIFEDVAKVDWEKHLPVMYNFWESILFRTNAYTGNAMQKHIHLNRETPLRREHFERWVSLFLQTVDEKFRGEKAELAKQRAMSIATMMQIKVSQAETNRN